MTSGLKFRAVRNPFRIQPGSAERLAAAAGTLRVGVLDFKPLALQAVVEVDERTLEVGMAGGIEQDRETLALETLVIGLRVV